MPSSPPEATTLPGTAGPRPAADAPAGAGVGALPAYLRALWGLAPRLAGLAPPSQEGPPGPQRAVLSDSTAPGRGADPDAPPPGARSGDALALHLPPGGAAAHGPAWARASAAHAAAHWRHGGPPVPRGGLRPVQTAIYGVLEDARVEALALRALPGLRALWLPFHAGDAALRGEGAEALLARLAHALLDPAHRDPHPWIARALRLCLGAGGEPALEDAAAVRRTAALLGNDLGQMRLPFPAGGCSVHAAYRDDNRHLWLETADAPPSGPPEAGGAGASAPPGPGSAPPAAPDPAPRRPGDDAPTAAPDEAVARYPEWDRRIRRFRPDWCAVFAPPAALPPAGGAVAAPAPAASRAMLRAVRGLSGRPAPAGGRSREGDDFHPDGLVGAGIDLRLQRPPDPRVHRAARPRPQRRAVLLLLDASASTARRLGDDGRADPGAATVLHRLRDACAEAVRALEAAGHRTAVHAFATYGRQRVELRCLKPWDEPAAGPRFARRLAALESGGSTRLGAVLRHGLALSAQDAARHPGLRRAVVLVTDGEPHDVDVHDPAYLPADLRQAVREAGRQGIAARCLAVLPGDAGRRPLADGFGPRACAVLRAPRDLPARLAALLAADG